jgi:hypothetical protein
MTRRSHNLGRITERLAHRPCPTCFRMHKVVTLPTGTYRVKPRWAMTRGRGGR